MNSKYKAIIFDLDGTLLDTSTDLANAVNYVLKKYGFPQRTKEDVVAFTGNGIYELVKKSIEKEICDELFCSIMDDFKKYYALHNTDNTKPYNGIHEILEILHKNGYKLAVVSNKIDSATKALCKQFFSDCIHTAIGDTPGISKKPQSGTLNIALKELNVTNNEIIYIGDSEVDVFTAQNASVAFIAAAWGFRSKEFLKTLGAENIANSPFEITDLIDNM